MKIKYLSPLCCVWLAGFAAFADSPPATNNIYSGDTWALVDAKKALAAAADITLAKYPDCDEATVEKRLVRVYNADGTGECQDEAYVKVLTEKGKRNNRTLAPFLHAAVFDGGSRQAGGHKARRHSRAVDVAANSKETIDDSQMQKNIYDPNSRVLQVNIPELEIGDVVHSVIAPDHHALDSCPANTPRKMFSSTKVTFAISSYEVHAPLGPALATDCLARRSFRHGPVLHAARAGSHHHLPLGSQQCAPHV